MSEILIYVVMKRAHGGIINTAKAFDSMHTARSYARQLNMSQTDESEYYVEKCFLRKNKK
ncbi:hypothetical protein LOOC260_109790 [Paucilactobacillus hokkaidonensis JCM 18461]|uniref:Uncharacterized protein n=2 Tax=Paucilactobacillus hokkaidonensis TaxID=1193095 RepID=A0A0A1GX48_9LACO|nr:hypothetical protein [Paucilactobacillus hokkaidonensis]BAP85518.1 hypothetical protein LOOC260_109790 [Paucilactobacillus hokkaidonensis JCM 18461]